MVRETAEGVPESPEPELVPVETSARHTKVRCFARDDAVAEFQTAVQDLLGRIAQARTRQYVAPENTQRFNHGGRWVRAAAETGDLDGNLETMSAGFEISFKDIAENNLSVLPKLTAAVTESLERQFTTSLFSKVSDAADGVGNVVQAPGHESIAAAWLEMMRKIEFGVDVEGNVSLPTCYVGTDFGPKLMAELEKQPPEFREELERIKAEKSEAALAREAERKAKFKSSSA